MLVKLCYTFSTATKGAAMITEDDLYAIGMESPHAWHKMRELCAALGLPFPPRPAHMTQQQKDEK
jgi:hypothetical protein